MDFTRHVGFYLHNVCNNSHIKLSRDYCKCFILSWIGIFIVGFAIEVVSDQQKSAFRAVPENKEKFITSGLWSKSQHPNYFGEILLWSAIALLSISSLNGTQYLTLISPIFTYVLLVYISGVRMLDDMGNKKWGHLEEYKEYKRNTPTLFLKL